MVPSVRCNESQPREENTETALATQNENTAQKRKPKSPQMDGFFHQTKIEKTKPEYPVRM